MWGDDFHKKFQILEKKKFSFYFISFNFLCHYCCSKNFKRQSEPSGLGPDTSSLVGEFNFTYLADNGSVASVVQNGWQNCLWTNNIVLLGYVNEIDWNTVVLVKENRSVMIFGYGRQIRWVKNRGCPYTHIHVTGDEL